MPYRTIIDFAGTIGHDGRRLTDDLSTPAGLAAWVRANAGHFAEVLEPSSYAPTEDDLARIVALRAAVRRLFAAVAPAPEARGPATGAPWSECDDGGQPLAAAVAEVNSAAALLGPAQLEWSSPAAPRRHRPADPAAAVLGALGAAAVEFLAGPERERLRACRAPRCVRYFLKQDPRQEWCRPACGNRARVARFHDRHHRAPRTVFPDGAAPSAQPS